MSKPCLLKKVVQFPTVETNKEQGLAPRKNEKGQGAGLRNDHIEEKKTAIFQFPKRHKKLGRTGKKG